MNSIISCVWNTQYVMPHIEMHCLIYNYVYQHVLRHKKNVFCLSITPLRKLYLFKMCARVSESVILYDNKL